MLPVVALTLLSLLASVALTLASIGSPLAIAHLAFAVGIVPLIFAAMLHFVPVLTRTGDPAPAIRRLPLVAQGCGVLAVLAMQGLLPRPALHAAATVDLLLAAILLQWIMRRARATLGSPHPGWRWYAAALGALALALTAVLAIALFPEAWAPLRLLHLHLNTLGLVGLAALGTLPVLLPTALGKPDPEAAGWLRRRLSLSAGGVGLVATGAALGWEFAVPGAALLLVVVLGLFGQWARRFGWRSVWADGVGASLAAALFGLALVLLAGVLHGAGLTPARATLQAWAAGFLLPLVTGALSQLLPVWRWPGPQTPARRTMRERLAATGLWRSAAFLIAALAALAGFDEMAAASLVLALGLFASGVLRGWRS